MFSKNKIAANVIQFIKFGIVGLSNTAISYGLEQLCYYVLFAKVLWNQNVKITVISIIAFLISVTNSYYWNNKYVFKRGKRTRKEHLITYIKTIACYALTGLLLSPSIKIWLNDEGVPFWLASLASLVITIPMNYLMNKFWAFSKKGNDMNKIKGQKE